MNANPVSLFNTSTRKIETFTPVEPGKASIYCCGPTVYSYQHIGNFRTFLFEDLLIRTLLLAGYEVCHVMNITDVGHLTSDGDEGEDKMVLAARREKKTSYEIAEYYTNIFERDWDALGIRKPNIVCKATDHVGEMIALIQRLEERGMTYTAGGNVYYDVSKFPTYGDFAKLDLEGQQTGTRVGIDTNKRNPYDFVLWFTKSKFEDQEMQWESPWGRGYPGWHIECSAMSMKYLGEVFDIHCGGIDHVPVHHTNEIAQSEGATGKSWVRYWMHSEFLIMKEAKMSKSKGDTVTVSLLQERGYDPLAYRLFCLGAHYRSQLTFTWEALDSAQSALRKLRSYGYDLRQRGVATDHTFENESPHINTLRNALFDDLNSSKALAALWGVVHDDTLDNDEKFATLQIFDSTLGLDLTTYEPSCEVVPAEVQELASARQRARDEKNWEEADALRDKIAAAGYQVEDGPEGPVVKKT